MSDQMEYHVVIESESLSSIEINLHFVRMLEVFDCEKKDKEC